MIAPDRDFLFTDILRGLSGVDDEVISVCPECSFEMRTGIGGKTHGRLCSKRSPEGEVDTTATDLTPLTFTGALYRLEK